MNWQRIKCAIFGHKWHLNIGPNIAAERNCSRCGLHVPAIKWPVPQMPACKPPKPEHTALRLVAGETLVLKVDRRLTVEQHQNLEAHAQRRLPEGVRVLVLAKGVSVAATVSRCGSARPCAPYPYDERGTSLLVAWTANAGL